MKKKAIGMVVAALVAFTMSASAQIIYQDNFNYTNDTWGVRLVSTGTNTVTFTGSTLKFQTDGQPSAAYRDHD